MNCKCHTKRFGLYLKTMGSLKKLLVRKRREQMCALEIQEAVATGSLGLGEREGGLTEGRLEKAG